uniref:Uncharacterized protein n=1 Tax=Knipowitschia caucasica TaxID=637954 RepID=A0AAV2IRL1_KNICA
MVSLGNPWCQKQSTVQYQGFGGSGPPCSTGSAGDYTPLQFGSGSAPIISCSLGGAPWGVNGKLLWKTLRLKVTLCLIILI